MVLATPAKATKTSMATVNWYTPSGGCDLNGFVTFTQGGWGSPSNSAPGIIRDTYFSTVFPSGMTIGGNYTIKLTSAAAVMNFLPQGGTAAALYQNYTNPNYQINVLAGQVAALTLNVAYSNAGKLGTNTGKLGDLVIVGGTFAGKTVSQFLAVANSALGGASTGYAISDINTAATALNENFDNGTVDKGYVSCEVPKASLGDKVWLDSNHNGIQDAGENGVSGVTVKLYDCNGTYKATTTTDANGLYSFTNLTAGSYYVVFTLPSGYSFSAANQGSDDAKDSDADATGKTACVTLAGGDNNTTLDAGISQCLNTIGDFVWRDKNANGIQDAGEPGIQGVVVELLNGTTVTATSTTDANGLYQFTNVANGTYTVRIAASNFTGTGVLANSASTKWYATAKNQGTDDLKDSDGDVTAHTASVTVSCANNNTIDFGFYKTCISFQKTGPASIKLGETITYTFRIENCGDLVLHGGVDVVDALLNPTGDHIIANGVVEAGAVWTFTKTYTPKASDCGNLVNDATAIGHPVLPNGTALSEYPQMSSSWTTLVDCSKSAKLGDKVWLDVNKNGVQDAGEAGVANVTVKLYDCSNNTLVATQVTDANGNYLFDQLNPGSYKVVFVLPANYFFTTKDAGTDDTKDSDADVTTGTTTCYTLIGGQTDLTVDAGVYYVAPKSSLGDFVWNDVNKNGIQDSGENGIANVTVELHKCSDNSLVSTTLTDASGKYLFSNLDAGDYYVKFVVVSGYSFSPANQGTDDAKDSDADASTGKTGCITLAAGENNLTVDAGMYQCLNSIGDFVWRDKNANGIQDAGETGIQGVVVELLNSSSTVIATSTTNASGFYQFTSLVNGTYTVRIAASNFTGTGVLASSASTKWYSSPVNQGTDDTKDSDGNVTTHTVSVTLNCSDNPTIDFGFYKTCMTFQKTGPATVKVGETITYTFRVENCGDLTLHGGVDIIDPLLKPDGDHIIANNVVEPGAVWTFTKTYVTTSANCGNLVNDAQAVGHPVLPNGTYVDNLTMNSSWTTNVDCNNSASLGDKVWLDVNKNGIQDAGEAGVANVTVKLYDCTTNTLVSTKVTDANGNYLFTNLNPGSYKVVFVLPANYFFTTKDAGSDDALDSDADVTTGTTTCYTLVGGQTNLTVDAGVYYVAPKATLGDKVWIDTNKNGIQEAGEVGLAGVTVQLYNCTGTTVVATQVTDAAGNYLFTNLIPGDYKVKFILPANYFITVKDAGTDDALDSDADASTGFTACYTLAGGDVNLTADAGVYYVAPKATLGDKVWIDTNKNGIQDAGEVGLAGVTVQLYNCTGTTVVATQVTDAAGNYLFTNLIPGDYKVKFILPANYFITVKDAGTDDALDSDADASTGFTACYTLAGGDVNLTADAGVYYVAPKATLGDKVWIDVNKNGIQDAGEVGLAGVMVQLYNCTGTTVIATQVTDAAGNYLFTNLIPGDYKVKFILPANYFFTVKDAGTNDALDSDADASTGFTACYTLAGGDVNLTADAGVYYVAPKATLGDKVWIDVNKNGIQEAGEVGLAGVMVQLYDCAGTTLVSSMVTDANGNYLFTNLTPGDYKVKFILPANYYFTVKDAGTEDALDSDADIATGFTGCYTLAASEVNLTVDAGVYYVNPKATLGDKIWIDANKNGIQDQYEVGLAGVTVQLYDCDGTTVLKSMITDWTGNYLFTDLTPGSYKVKFILPADYYFTTKDAGTNDAIDSDADVSTGFTGCYTLAAGDVNLTVDAGVFYVNPKVTIGDKVWIDVNKDGKQDASEVGLANVTVQLYDCNTNTMVASMVTNATGNYLFTNLNPGSYKVKFILPANYYFTVPNAAGVDDALDSDADVLTGFTNCYTLNPGDVNLTVDAGAFFTPPQTDVDLRLTKTASNLNPQDGDQVTYTITVTNYGPATATGVTATDLLPVGLTYVSNTTSQGTYNELTGLWTIGTLANGASATLTITVTVHLAVITTTTFDLGVAKDYNLFVLNDLDQPSSDTQGKVAVGHNATLSAYSVGDRLPATTPVEDVLIVDNNLTFTSGAVYNGNIVVGGTTNLPTGLVSINNGTLKHGHPINFAAAATYFSSLTAQLAGYTVNAPTVFQWGGLTLTGTDPYKNVFNVSGANLSAANNVAITAPNGSVVVVNVSGTNVSWTGGFTVSGTSSTNVLFNFYEATSLRIQGIDVTGSILAPFADVNFVSGVQNGQMVARNVHGMGQFNHVRFLGNIPTENNIINVAEVTTCDQNDPNSTPGNGIPSENDYASVTIHVTKSGSGNGNGNGGWTQVGTFTSGEVVWTIKIDASGQLLAGTLCGKIYRSTNNGLTWTVINGTMSVKNIWSIVTTSTSIFAATEQGVYVSVNNGSTWTNCGLAGKDVRALALGQSNVIYAGAWGAGVYKSTDNGSTWTEINTGLTNLNVDAITVTAANHVYVGTFGAGVFKSVNQGASWTNANIGYDFVWALGVSASGNIIAGTYGDGIYRSTNNGTSWGKANTGLPARFVYSITFDATDKIYISTFEGGIFASNDGGATWNNVGMGGCGASSVAASVKSKSIFVGTNNGAIYQTTNGVNDVKLGSAEVPAKFELHQNYPNPFNPSTVIKFSVPESGNYVMKVYNVIGQLVSTLANGYFESGNYTVNFDASGLPSGLYVYQMVGKDINITKKMLLQK